MMNTASGFKTLAGAERAAAKCPQHESMIIRTVRRVWSDDRFINVAICYTAAALQHAVSCLHLGHKVYVTDWKWLLVEVADTKMTDVQRALVMHSLTGEGNAQIQPATSATQLCEWFARCTRPAVTKVPHPVLGEVPCCAKCAAFAGHPVQNG